MQPSLFLSLCLLSSSVPSASLYKISSCYPPACATLTLFKMSEITFRHYTPQLEKKRPGSSLTACINCRKAHAACNTWRPCDRCVRMQCECQTKEKKKKKGLCSFHTSSSSPPFFLYCSLFFSSSLLLSFSSPSPPPLLPLNLLLILSFS